MASAAFVKVTKLGANGVDNFITWKSDMTLVLGNRGLWSLVGLPPSENELATVSKPPARREALARLRLTENTTEAQLTIATQELRDAETELEALLNNRMAAAAQISLSLEDIHKLTIIGFEDSPRTMWNTLMEANQSNSTMSVLTLHVQLQSLKMSESDDLEEYTRKFEQLLMKIQQLGPDALSADKRNAATWLIGLPPKFDTVKTVIMNDSAASTNNLSFQSVKRRVMEQWRMLKLNADRPTMLQSSFAAIFKGNGDFHTNPVTGETCRHRKHDPSQCWVLHPELRPRIAPGRGPQRHHNDLKRPRQRESGHVATFPPTGTGIGAGCAAPYVYGRSIQPSAYTALVLPGGGGAAMVAESMMDPDVWLLDSGASSHMTNDRSALVNVRSINPVTISCGGNTIQATEVGELNATMVTSCSSNIPVALRDVLYVPQLVAKPLISALNLGSQLGISSTIDGQRCTLSKNGNVLGVIEPRSGVFPVKLIVSSSRSPSTETAAATVTRSTSKRARASTASTTDRDNQRVSADIDALVWHARLGHLNIADMGKLRHVAIGFDYNPGTASAAGSIAIEECYDCLIGKAHRLPHPPLPPYRRATDTLELIHSDLCGPMPASERDGHVYFMTFIDDRSRYGSITMLKKKSEAFAAFIGFRTMIENQTGRRIRALRSDNGGEYISKDFNEYLRSYGIQHQLTTPYTPQQNGVAERFNQTLVTSATAMLEAASLPTTYWADAVMVACYVRNRVPHSALTNGVTPFEAMMGRLPDLSNLRVFGCRAFATIPQAQRTKFGPRAYDCVMLGYEPQHRAWRLFCLDTGAMMVSSSASFLEHRFVSECVRRGENLSASTRPRSSINESNDDTDSDSDCECIEMRPTNRQRKNESVSSSSQPLQEQSHDRSSSPALSPQQHEDEDVSGSRLSSEVQPALAPAPAPGTGTGTLTVQPSTSVASARERYIEGPLIDNELSEFVRTKNIAVGTKMAKLREITDGTRFNAQDVHRYLRRCNDIASHSPAIVHTAHAVQAIEAVSRDPLTHKQAMADLHSADWREAEREEFQSIINAGTWTLVEIPNGRQAIGCKWVYKTKLDAHGQLVKRKARLVAKGFTQRQGVDFEETFAPVVRFSSIRALLAIAAHLDLEIHQMDVKTAFLNGDISEDIYMRQPEGFEVAGQEHLVCKLNKSLYGLKQAGRAWYLKIDSALIALSFHRLQSDNCIYVRRTSPDVLTIIALYVDDLLILSNSLDSLATVKRHLSSQFDMKDLGEASFILGIQIERDRPQRLLAISQTEYVRQLVAKFGLENSRRDSRTPMTAGLALTKNNSLSTAVRTADYQAAIGSIMYAMLGTRPDIAYAISRLAQYCVSPSQQHWDSVKKVVRYLASTEAYKIVYDGAHDRTAQPQLIGFCDADYANNTDDRRSITGFAFLIAGGAVSWQSKRQTSVATSTVEAEYMASASAAREAMSFRSLLSEIGLAIHRAPTIIWSDNQGAIALSKNPEHHARVKHIDIRHHYVRERAEHADLVLKYVNTENMVADVLTKALAAPRHSTLVAGLGLRHDLRPSEGSGSNSISASSSGSSSGSGQAH